MLLLLDSLCLSRPEEMLTHKIAPNLCCNLLSLFFGAVNFLGLWLQNPKIGGVWWRVSIGKAANFCKVRGTSSRDDSFAGRTSPLEFW